MRARAGPLRLPLPERGVYLGAVRDDGTASLVESRESVYEARACALAHLRAETGGS